MLTLFVLILTTLFTFSFSRPELPGISQCKCNHANDLTSNSDSKISNNFQQPANLELNATILPAIPSALSSIQNNVTFTLSSSISNVTTANDNFVNVTTECASACLKVFNQQTTTAVFTFDTIPNNISNVKTRSLEHFVKSNAKSNKQQGDLSTSNNSSINVINNSTINNTIETSMVSFVNSSFLSGQIKDNNASANDNFTTIIDVGKSYHLAYKTAHSEQMSTPIHPKWKTITSAQLNNFIAVVSHSSSNSLLTSNVTGIVFNDSTSINKFNNYSFSQSLTIEENKLTNVSSNITDIVDTYNGNISSTDANLMKNASYWSSKDINFTSILSTMKYEISNSSLNINMTKNVTMLTPALATSVNFTNVITTPVFLFNNDSLSSMSKVNNYSITTSFSENGSDNFSMDNTIGYTTAFTNRFGLHLNGSGNNSVVPTSQNRDENEQPNATFPSTVKNRVTFSMPSSSPRLASFPIDSNVTTMFTSNTTYSTNGVNKPENYSSTVGKPTNKIDFVFNNTSHFDAHGTFSASTQTSVLTSVTEILKYTTNIISTTIKNFASTSQTGLHFQTTTDDDTDNDDDYFDATKIKESKDKKNNDKLKDKLEDLEEFIKNDDDDDDNEKFEKKDKKDKRKNKKEIKKDNTDDNDDSNEKNDEKSDYNRNSKLNDFKYKVDDNIKDSNDDDKNDNDNGKKSKGKRNNKLKRIAKISDDNKDKDDDDK